LNSSTVTRAKGALWLGLAAFRKPRAPEEFPRRDPKRDRESRRRVPLGIRIAKALKHRDGRLADAGAGGELLLCQAAALPRVSESHEPGLLAKTVRRIYTILRGVMQAENYHAILLERYWHAAVSFC
jgi:hypothetical protein